MTSGRVDRTAKSDRDRGGSASGTKRESRMTRIPTDVIKKGWKVYAGPYRIGEVTRILDDSLTVRRGRLFKREYLIPLHLISDASNGIVDLRVGRDAVQLMEA